MIIDEFELTILIKYSENLISNTKTWFICILLNGPFIKIRSPGLFSFHLILEKVEFSIIMNKLFPFNVFEIDKKLWKSVKLWKRHPEIVKHASSVKKIDEISMALRKLF